MLERMLLTVLSQVLVEDRPKRLGIGIVYVTRHLSFCPFCFGSWVSFLGSWTSGFATFFICYIEKFTMNCQIS